MKSVQRLAMLALIAVLLVIAGCSSGSTPPKQAFQDAMKNMEDLNSYSTQMSLGIDNLELPAGALQNGIDVTSVVLGMLKGAKLDIKAVYAKEPQRTDMELNLQLSGTTITIPMILTAEKLYMKLPALPMLQLPESAAGKFIELDLKALAEQQGAAAALDTASAQKFAQELGAVVLKHFDEETYFSNVKAKDANLPEDVKAEHIIRFAIDDSNYKESVETIVNDMLPELLKVIASNESYLQMIQKSKEDVEKMQTYWETNKAEASDFLNKNVKLNEL
jgi:outer membrane murein-binding lipoprotein Lpp